MKKSLFTLATLIFCMAAFSQADDEPKGPSDASWAYEQYRSKITRPPYALEKVLGLIKSAPSSGDDGGTALSSKVYGSLTLREKFTYNMVHGESYSQNCDAGMARVDEEKKIWAELPGPFGDEHWSGRQMDFFNEHRDSVITLMAESIERSHRVGLNYKKVIDEINATELIPLLIDTYNADKRDHDILTVLMLLMLAGKYPAFIKSSSYTKLYASKDSRWEAFLNLNSANEALIIQRATDFYNGLPKKTQ
jgi:hypothetical protein